MIDKNKFYCRICGLEQLEAPWGDDDKTANFEICGCCGCEFGCDDYNIDVIREYRKQWLSGKLKWQNNVSYFNSWFRSSIKPNNWSLEKQLKQIPKKFLWVHGQIIEFHAKKLENGKINIGIYFIKKVAKVLYLTSHILMLACQQSLQRAIT